MEIVIEKLKNEDLKEAISIYDENYNLKTNYDRLFHIYDKIDHNPLYHNIVAKVNGKIVAMATVILHYDIVEQCRPFLTVWNFGVKKEFRKNKIGTQMFEYIYDLAKKNHCDFISLMTEKDNLEAQAFYEKIGYTKEIGYIKLINKEEW